MEIVRLFPELAEPESSTGNARNNGVCKVQKQQALADICYLSKRPDIP